MSKVWQKSARRLDLLSLLCSWAQALSGNPPGLRRRDPHDRNIIMLSDTPNLIRKCPGPDLQLGSSSCCSEVVHLWPIADRHVPRRFRFRCRSCRTYDEEEKLPLDNNRRIRLHVFRSCDVCCVRDHTRFQSTKFVRLLLSAVVCRSFDRNSPDSKEKTGIQIANKTSDSQANPFFCAYAPFKAVVG